jgi:hypothetical protein
MIFGRKIFLFIGIITRQIRIALNAQLVLLEISRAAFIMSPMKSPRRTWRWCAEHPFGTFKRQWGFDHSLTKKWKETSLFRSRLYLIAYNPKRVLSLMGKKGSGKSRNGTSFIWFGYRSYRLVSAQNSFVFRWRAPETAESIMSGISRWIIWSWRTGLPILVGAIPFWILRRWKN